VTVRIIQGDALTVLKSLPAESVNCCVTSPPYWALRDYGVEGQLGLERTPEEYINKVVEIFRVVWRVLRNDGTLWLNLGDSYAGGGCGARDPSRWPKQARNDHMPTGVKNKSGFKPKDLIGIPWLVAFALRADGWYLRRDIIWEKPNCMPESCKDRPTTSHEYIFLLAKSVKYYYDAEAVKLPCSPDTHPRYARGRSVHHKYADGGTGGQTIAKSFDHMIAQPGVNPKAAMAAPTGWDTGVGSHVKKVGRYKQNPSFSAAVKDVVENRNLRSVWRVPSHPFSGAHFATFPPKLIEPCLLAGCPVGGTVLDPFGGSGTVGMVAENNGRNSILIELNPKYVEMAKRRTSQTGIPFTG
jgi:DNA modification methylase